VASGGCQQNNSSGSSSVTVRLPPARDSAPAPGFKPVAAADDLDPLPFEQR
jgi:hypothetical protein